MKCLVENIEDKKTYCKSSLMLELEPFIFQLIVYYQPLAGATSTAILEIHCYKNDTLKAVKSTKLEPGASVELIAKNKQTIHKLSEQLSRELENNYQAKKQLATILKLELEKLFYEQIKKIIEYKKSKNIQKETQKSSLTTSSASS